MKYPEYFPPITEVKYYVNYKPRPETKYLVVHCAASQNLPKFDWKTIDQIHRAQGWLGIGYHFVIRTNGEIQEGRPLDTIGSHVKGHNSDSVGICLIGGVDSNGRSENNFTDAQMKSLLELLDALRTYYRDSVEVLGHRDFKGVRKDCPCFDVKTWYKENSTAKFAVMDDDTETNLSSHDFKMLNGDCIPTGTKVRVR